MKRKGKKMVGVVLMVVMIMAMTVPAQAARSDSFITLYYGYYYSGTLDVLEHSEIQSARVSYHAGYYLSSPVVETLSVSR